MEEKNNGHVTEKEQAILDGRVCGRCKTKMVHFVLTVKPPPPPGKIALAPQAPPLPLAIPMCLCINQYSDKFGCIIATDCSCEHFEDVPQPQRVEIPDKIKNRMG